LENGDIDLREALDQPRLWIAEFNAGGVQRLVRSSFAAVSEWVPDSGVMLYPEQEPLLAVRSLGKDVELGHASLGVLKTSLDNVRACLKTLADFAVGAPATTGQPRATVRKYYDLPARLLAGRLKVCVFAQPEDQASLFEDDVWQRMEAALERGLDCMSDLGSAPPPEDDPELNAALLAVHRLAPPSHGAVERTEISGRLSASHEAVQITRDVGAALRQRFQRPARQKPQIIEDSGVISELDFDESTCKLRDDQGRTIHDLSFDETLLEDVKSAFDNGSQVRIAGKSNQGLIIELLAVEFLS